MKTYLTVIALFFACWVSADGQTHKWLSVETTASGKFQYEIDRNFVRVPGGIIQYWTRTTYRSEEINQFEVNCLKQEYRKLDGQDSSWTLNDESSYGQIAEVVCSIANLHKTRPPKTIEKPGIRIGMTKRQVLASSWGKPLRINQTITASRVFEQWVYEGQAYLYFDNGRLISITLSR